jgi:DNA-binding transcriptional MerR regulator
MEEVQKALERVPEKSYYRIGEVARITGVKPYVLRYWETEFKAMTPPKSRSQQRMYRRRDIETILTIKQLLYKERFTIEGARKRLAELARDPAPKTDAEPERPELIRHLRSELQDLRRRLAEA